ncbi:MAG: hypothetical protein OXU72_15685, partial [Gammaproteobacteria bacterium]|nr:hypothetical protein [Gammaproteobacteria bacterium]
MTIRVVNHTGNGVANANFSKERYLSPGWMDREWERIWARCWLLAGLESDIAEPGDVFEHTEILNGNRTMTDTIDQDIELLGGVQAGMASKGFDRVWLSDEELRVQH